MLARGVRLAERRVLRVAGEDALKLLQGLVTNDVRGLAAPGAPPVYAAVLAANGRVAHDAFFHREMGEGPSGGALLVDLPAATFEDAVKLLTKMRLRARVTLDDAGEDLAVVAVGGEEEPGVRSKSDEASSRRDATSTSAPASSLLAFLPPDPRLASLGLRGVLPRAVAEALIEGGVEMARTHGRSGGSDADFRRGSAHVSEAAAHRRLRYALGVAEGAELVGLLPLECNLAGLNAVSFEKGCYVGQELTARTHHRGVVRKRIVPASFHHHVVTSNVLDDAFETERANERSASPLFVAPGSRLFPMEEDEFAPATSARAKPAGSVVASSGDVGLAMARLSHLKRATRETGTTGGDADALAHSTTLTARFIARDESQSRASAIATRVWTPPWWDARWTSRSDDAEA